MHSCAYYKTNNNMLHVEHFLIYNKKPTIRIIIQLCYKITVIYYLQYYSTFHCSNSVLKIKP